MILIEKVSDFRLESLEMLGNIFLIIYFILNMNENDVTQIIILY